MAQGSTIEWTESTWNPVTGCSKISPGCKHCYAERMAMCLKAMGQPNYERGFKVTLQEHMLELPLLWRKPQTIFVNSMSDLFHREVPDAFRFSRPGPELLNIALRTIDNMYECAYN
jgi:protein gp37